MIHLIFISFFMFQPLSGSDWILKKEKSGIEIYTRSIKGSLFDEFRGTAVIPNSSLELVLAVILDVKNYEKLYPDCKNPVILKQDGRYYDVHQIEVNAPWPVKPRDAIYEQITSVDQNGKYALITLKPLPDFVAEKEGFVRIQKGNGFWELKEVENHSVKIIYQFHGEPGGDVPAWLVNNFVETHPYQTLKNLINRINR